MAAFNPVGFGVLVLLGAIFAYQLKGSLSAACALLTGTDPGSASPGDLVVATGTATARTEPIEAPVSGVDCVGYVAVLDQR